MKLNVVLYRQHIDRMFKKHWLVQGKRVAIETGADEELRNRNVPIFDPQEVLQEKLPPIKLDIVGFKPQIAKPIPKERQCYIFGDKSVLVDGVVQAQVLLKTIVIEDKTEVEKSKFQDDIKPLIQQAVLSSHAYDAQQEKLPIRKDPVRPAWNFPRDYGITHARRMRLLTTKLLKICEAFSPSKDVLSKLILSDIGFTTTFEKDGELVQLQLTADKLILSDTPLALFHKSITSDDLLPDIFPLSPVISIPTSYIYDIKNEYPIQNLNNFTKVPHTIFVYYDKTQVSNVYETEVTQSQITARALLKTFNVAASFVRNRIGKEEMDSDLKDPITIQCICTDGQFFQFGKLQLNTLNLSGNDGVKNVWHCSKPINLFENCLYKSGRPVLEGLNLQVFDKMNSFYHCK